MTGKCVSYAKNLTTKKQKPVCPAKSKKDDRGARYRISICNVVEFNTLVDQADVFDLTVFGGNENAFERLYENNASWHNSCRLLYCKSRIERLRSNKPQEYDVDEIPTTSGRKSSVRRIGIRSDEILERNRNECMFCGEDCPVSTLHAVQDDRTQDKIKSATELIQSYALLATFELGDLFAQKSILTCNVMSSLRDSNQTHPIRKSLIGAAVLLWLKLFCL